jgi:23S rRNA (pseudouridine1915-N3)-methyltransferase
MPQGAYVIILDRQGQVFNNETLAKKIDTLQQKNSQLVLIIGGSHGIDESIVALAKEKWSFSALTFPHQLFRLLLLEQLYRSMTILKGHPYHK